LAQGTLLTVGCGVHHLYFNYAIESDLDGPGVDGVFCDSAFTGNPEAACHD